MVWFPLNGMVFEEEVERANYVHLALVAWPNVTLALREKLEAGVKGRMKRSFWL
jgi:hypothetical protein